MKTEFKKALFNLMISHSKLAEAEYKRNPGYNSDHFSHKAEEAVIEYLQKNNPEIFEEFLKING